MVMPKQNTVAIIGTLDTKEKEMRHAAQALRQNGTHVLLLDATVRHPMEAPGSMDAADDIDIMVNTAILSACGKHWEAMSGLHKDERLRLMADCLHEVTQKLFRRGALQGLLTIGGAQNTAVSLKAMHAMPLGFPKVLLSTVASGSRPFNFIMGTTDMVAAQAVADISGLNFLTKNSIENAAYLMLGLLQASATRSEPLKGPALPAVGMTLLGVTNLGGERCRAILEKKGFETVCFHATGVGGQVLDNLVRDTDNISGVLELTPHEIIGEFMGGYTAGATERISACCAKGLPMVLAPGAMDLYMVDLNRQPVPDHLQTRKHLYHNAKIIHVKLSVDEAVRMAHITASRLNLNPASKTVLIPLRGFVEEGCPGGRMYAPEVDKAFTAALKEKLHPSIMVQEMDNNIIDQEFAAAMVNELERLMRR